jgi:hypothetical protein
MTRYANWKSGEVESLVVVSSTLTLVTSFTDTTGEQTMAQYRPVLTTDPGPRFDACLNEVNKLLRRAADEWAKGNPEDPLTKDVLNQILDIFAREKFLKRPYGKGPT